jgi:hypothetical protein
MAAPGARAVTATFENFDGGSLGNSFTDPLSGITFSDPTFPQNDFSIQYAGAWPTMPSMTPGHYLVGAGYSSDGGLILASGFGLTATLPSLARTLSMDVGYGNFDDGHLRVDALDSADNIVATVDVFPPVESFVEMHVQLESANVDIHKFRTTATDLAVGYDNIAFDVPEPMLAGLGGVLILFRRASKRTK